MIKLPSIFFPLLLLFAGNSYSETAFPIRSKTMDLMGTKVEVVVSGEAPEIADKGIKAAFEKMELVDRLMSNYKNKSDVSLIAAMAGKNAVKVSPWTFEVIKKGIYYGNLTGGAFDITVGKIKNLYKFQEGGEVPGQDQIKNQLKFVGYQKIKVIEPDKIYLPLYGMEIDLGGIAKGYAVDKAVEELEKRGIRNALVNAGGNIRVKGRKNGKLWNIGILDPGNQGKLIGTLSLEDMSVATSGDYMQFFERDGKKYTHIIEPKTGNTSMLSSGVTVIAPLAIDADALSTSLFILGSSRGINLIKKMETVEAIIISKDKKIVFSKGIRKYLRDQ